ncbi:MAG: AMP-binding protein, partial [Spirochaetales bacterium]|nr:AMP-binding protein [Spirochaetales bacterium]
MLFVFFCYTLVSPPPLIFRLAILRDKTIKGSLAEKRVEKYCGRVTLLWCAFFVINGGIAAFTVFFTSDTVWTLYNGGVSYILMGILFGGELMIRTMAAKKMPKAVALSRFTYSSRADDTVMCYDSLYTAGEYKTWKDFLADTALMRRVIRKSDCLRWILHCEDCWYFLVGFAALLQCKKHILLTTSVSPEYIAEIRSEGTAFLTDQTIQGTLHIPSLLDGDKNVSAEETALTPRIDPDETVIVMYTSGTTGKPKAVRQRLTEFETDNAFILSKWGEEFLKRKLCSTVSQHHIYGLLFSILLPFTAGTPFRRRRMQYPEEFEKLTDDSYMIITVPAFLKRSVEIENPESLKLRQPWIFTSGGVLTPETAKKTAEVFGFWPVEVYGSTETSGIAYRQSKNGPQWTAFDNALISKNDEGCLVIRSPYIKDPAGFTTGDLVTILDDGRFILKGRADSIVKIEEKRISLPEVENRLMQSGLVSDVCVVAMEDRRQYLAAALVLGPAGAQKFRGAEKRVINRYFQEYLLRFFENVLLPKKWRYLEALPLDAQGKKKRLDIQALFAPANPHGIPAEKVLEKTGTSVTLEIVIPPGSEYFDGHFPEFKLLP